MNKNKLKAQMVLHGDTNADLAEATNMSVSRFSIKLNSKGAEFTQGEIMAIKERYGLTARQVDDIFFSQGVS